MQAPALQVPAGAQFTIVRVRGSEAVHACPPVPRYTYGFATVFVQLAGAATCRVPMRRRRPQVPGFALLVATPHWSHALARWSRPARFVTSSAVASLLLLARVEMLNREE